MSSTSTEAVMHEWVRNHAFGFWVLLFLALRDLFILTAQGIPRRGNTDASHQRQAMEHLEADEEPCMESYVRPSPVVEGTTLESLTAEHARATRVHRESRMYRNTWEIFQQTVLQQSSLRVSSCICLCLGSLSGPPEDESEDPENKAILSQLVGFEGIIHLLKNRFNIEAVYFQDPVFNWLDKAFLESKGYIVLNSPHALNFITTETFLFTPHCPPGCVPACLERAFPSMALGHKLTNQTKWFYDSRSSPWDKDLGSKLPARYSSRGLYESFLRTHATIRVPVTKVPIIRNRRAKHNKKIKSRAPEYVPGPRMPLYYVADAWNDLPPVDSLFQVPKAHLLNRQQANAVFRSRGLRPWNATQDDNDVWDVLLWMDRSLSREIRTFIGRYLPSGLGTFPSLLWATVPIIYKLPGAMTRYAQRVDRVEDSHLSDFDKGSSEEEDNTPSPGSSSPRSSTPGSSSFWEDDPDPDSTSDMDID